MMKKIWIGKGRRRKGIAPGEEGPSRTAVEGRTRRKKRPEVRQAVKEVPGRNLRGKKPPIQPPRSTCWANVS